MKRKILMIGESYMNLQICVNPLTKSDGSVYGSQYSYHPSGDTAISAISASKLGADCVFSTKLGRDTNGERLYNYYASCGLNTEFIKKAESGQTGMSVTTYDKHGNAENIFVRGVNRFSKRDIDDAFSSYPDLFMAPFEALVNENDTGIVKTDGALGEEFDLFERESDNAGKSAKVQDAYPPLYDDKENNVAIYTITKATSQKVDLLVEYNRYSAMLPLEIISGIKALIIYREDIEALTGFRADSYEKLVKSLDSISVKIKSRFFIVPLRNGVALVYDGRNYEVVCPSEELIADENAQNERMNKTFAGAFAADFLDNRDVVRACKFACVASLKTRAMNGIVEHIPTKAEIDECVTKYNISLIRIKPQ